MTNYQLARMAVRVYPRHDLATRWQTNILRREWMNAIRDLGDRWILARVNHVAKRALQSL
jgi:hypothetical protein